MRGRDLAVAALAVSFSLIWSSAFVAGKIAVARLDPATVLSTRFALSALLLAPFAGRGALSEARLGLTLGALNNAAYLGLTFWALTFTRPVVVVAIVSCAPFLTAAMAAALRIEKVRPRQILGAIIGVIGVCVITGFNGAGFDLVGAALAALGTLCFCAGTLIFRARGAGASIAALNFWQSLAGAALLAPFALRAAPSLAAFDAVEIEAILYLAIVVTIGGMAMWFVLIRLSGAAKASAYHLMNPFFGALLSAAMLGTPLRANDLLGACVIAFGLWLATRTT